MPKSFIKAFLISMAVTSVVRADIIRGRVIDTLSKECIPYSNIEFLAIVNPSTGLFQHDTVVADSLGRFIFYAGGSGQLAVSMFTYHLDAKEKKK